MSMSDIAPLSSNPELDQAQLNAVDNTIAEQLADKADRVRGPFRRMRLKRASRNQRLLRRLRAEVLAEAAMSYNGSHDEFVEAFNSGGLDSVLDDDGFDWDEFLAFLEKLFELIMKFFL